MMNPMAETSQSENVSRETLNIGDRVKLSGAGRLFSHERLHGCFGRITGLTNGLSSDLPTMVTVTWDSVHMNSGSNERTQKNGPHVPRMRSAMSVLPLECLEAE